jgi:DnaJ-class molecular chaperone
LTLRYIKMMSEASADLGLLLQSTCKHCSGEGVLVTGSNSSSNSSAGSQHNKQHSSGHGSMAGEAAGATAAQTCQPHSTAAAHSAGKSRR